MVHGIIKALFELPLKAINDKTTVGEYGLTTTYYHPVLSSILSNPDKKVLLRWPNTESDSSRKKKPDAIISKLNQLAYGLGFGEVKAPKNSIDEFRSCHHLLCLGLFCKETIDNHTLDNGFSIVFLLMRLNHDGIYCFYEIAKMPFPHSLGELSSFVSLRNLNTLLRVSEVFWQLCKPLSGDILGSQSSRTRPTNDSLYDYIDPTRNGSRTCSLRLGD